MDNAAVPAQCIDEQRIDELAHGDDRRRADIRHALGLQSDSQTGDPAEGIEQEETGAGGQQVKRRRLGHESEQTGTPSPSSSLTRAHAAGSEDLQGDTKRQRTQAGAEEGSWIMPWEREPDWMPAHLARSRGEQRAEQGPADRPASRARGATGRSRSPRHRKPREKKQIQPTEAAQHELAEAGPLVFCMVCARYANKRYGSGLKGRCQRERKSTQDAVASRLRRLHEGRHPISGELLV